MQLSKQGLVYILASLLAYKVFLFRRQPAIFTASEELSHPQLNKFLLSNSVLCHLNEPCMLRFSPPAKVHLAPGSFERENNGFNQQQCMLIECGCFSHQWLYLRTSQPPVSFICLIKVQASNCVPCGLQNCFYQLILLTQGHCSKNPLQC